MSLPLWHGCRKPLAVVPQEMTLEPSCVSPDIDDYTTETDTSPATFRILLTKGSPCAA